MKAWTRNEPIILLLATAAGMTVTGVRPYDRTTSRLEVFPILLGAPLLAAAYRRFRLTPVLNRLIFIHAVILMVSGYYTYARVPLGFWVADLGSASL